MCAGAQLVTNTDDILRIARAAGLTISVPPHLSTNSWQQTIWGFGRWDTTTKVKTLETAPVILAKKNGIGLELLEFSLTPHCSKSYPFNAATYNTRLNRPKVNRGSRIIQTDEKDRVVFEYAYQFPAYRQAWARGQFCLVPLSAGIESSYAGTFDQQRFSFGLPNQTLMFVLGLWDEWRDPESSRFHRGFSLFTSFPQRAMRQFGHHREVVMVDHNIWSHLLDGRPKSRNTYALIRDYRLDPAYVAEHHSHLKTRKGEPNADDFLYPEDDLDAMGLDGRNWILERQHDTTAGVLKT